jgi:hypothetical protein
LLNPDVELLEGCVTELLAALDDGAAVAGPRFWLDTGRSALLPPLARTDLLDRWYQVRGDTVRARQRWRRHALDHWTAVSPHPSKSLPGAALLFRRDIWETHGPFDEGYFMYFEETEWLERLSRKGEKLLYVPDADVVHRFGGSTHNEADAKARFAESWRRYSRRGGYRWVQPLLETLANVVPVSRERPRPERWDAQQPLPLHQTCAWIEISHRIAGHPAVGIRRNPKHPFFELTSEVRTCLNPGTYFLRTITQEGREDNVHALTV